MAKIISISTFTTVSNPLGFAQYTHLELFSDDIIEQIRNAQIKVIFNEQAYYSTFKYIELTNAYIFPETANIDMQAMQISFTDGFPFILILTNIQDNEYGLNVLTPSTGTYSLSLSTYVQKTMHLFGDSRTYSHTVEPRFVARSSKTDAIGSYTDDDIAKISALTEQLPEVSAADDGKFLGIADGKLQALEIPTSGEGGGDDETIAEIQAAISQINTSISTINTRINSLNTRVGNLENLLPDEVLRLHVIRMDIMARVGQSLTERTLRVKLGVLNRSGIVFPDFANLCDNLSDVIWYGWIQPTTFFPTAGADACSVTLTDIDLFSNPSYSNIDGGGIEYTAGSAYIFDSIQLDIADPATFLTFDDQIFEIG